MSTTFLSVPALADYLAPAVRQTIAKALAESMRGEIVRELPVLEDAGRDKSIADVVGRGLGRAWLLHLDRRSMEALTVIDEEVLPNAYELPEEIRFAIEQNRLDAAFGQGFPLEDDVERHYGQIDRRNLLGITFRDSRALLAAAGASASGKNYDSLPVYSNALFKAYRFYNWRDIRQASEDLARELLRIKNPIDAVFYMMLSEDKEIAQEVADYLRSENNPDSVLKVVTKLTRVSHLSRHTAVACEFLSRLDDAIPDPAVSEWLARLRVARELPGMSPVERWISDPAWSATKALLPGATADQADGVISEVLGHPRWSGHDLMRREFYPVLQAAAEVASEKAIKKLIDAVIPHVISTTPGHDLDRAVSLLIAIAERSSELKAAVAAKISRTGKIGIPPLLATVAADAFGVSFNVDDPERMARSAFEHLGFQVERADAGTEPRTGLGENIIEHKQTSTGHVVVKIGSCAEELHTVASFRKDVPAPLMNELVRAILRNISDPQNVNTNRIMLLNVLPRLEDVMDASVVQQTVDVLAKLARDHREASHPLHGQSESYAQLNPFRFGHHGWPQEVRGEALLALAALVKHHADIGSTRLNSFLQAAMADPNSMVREFGYRAIAITGALTSDSLPALVAGTRDNDLRAANIALQAVGVQAQAVVAAGFASMVLGTVEVQCRNSEAGVRRATAKVVRQLQKALEPLGGTDVLRLQVVLDLLRRDVTRRVRLACSSPE
jgi:hypothetical protein